MKGFIQFSMDYYRNKVGNYEKEHISKEELYEAKQLLKAVDDVLDEGYTNLYNALEEEFELSSYLDQICLDAKSQASTAQNPFIGDLSCQSG